MGYWNEVVARFNLPHENFAGGSRISIFDDVGIYLEGHRGILSFNPTEIEVRLAKKRLLIKGERLRIACINRYELYIVGRIISVARVD